MTVCVCIRRIRQSPIDALIPPRPTLLHHGEAQCNGGGGFQKAAWKPTSCHTPREGEVPRTLILPDTAVGIDGGGLVYFHGHAQSQQQGRESRRRCLEGASSIPRARHFLKWKVQRTMGKPALAMRAERASLDRGRG